MPKYRKKPIVIEAVQFVVTSKTQRKYGVTIEHNVSEIAEFMGGIAHERTFPQEGNPNGRVCIEIETLEGTMYADVNDYIIKGINGEFYPRKPDIFLATYESVE